VEGFASKVTSSLIRKYFGSCDFVDRPCFSGQTDRSTKSHELNTKLVTLETTFEARFGGKSISTYSNCQSILTGDDRLQNQFRTSVDLNVTIWHLVTSSGKSLKSLSCKTNRSGSRSVPPRGSGWCYSVPFATANGTEYYGSRIRTHPLPRGGTDCDPWKRTL
jgi:hypothetical protein